MKNKIKYILAVLCTWQLLLSCENGSLSFPRHEGAEAYAHCPANGWEDTDTLFIQLPELANSQKAGLSLIVRYLTSYPLQNLSLQSTLEQVSPRKRRVTITQKKDTLGNILSETTKVDTVQDVRAIASWRTGFRLFERQNPIATHQEAKAPLSAMMLSKDYTYRLRVVHRMRQKSLTGISEVGVEVKP